MGFTSFASEFPNDNPAISSGAIWVGSALTGPARLELAPYRPVPVEPYVLYFDDEEGYVEGPIDIQVAEGILSVAVVTPPPACVDESNHVNEPELELDFHDGESLIHAEAEPTVPRPHASELPSAPAFAHFETALSTALLAQGATRAAALVPKLLRLEPLSADALAKDVLLTLQSRGYLDGHARYSAKFKDVWGAWSAVLSGASQDFAACGTTTLDRFGADLLAALLAVPATRSDELRRELRRAGIAAFGVLQAA